MYHRCCCRCRCLKWNNCNVINYIFYRCLLGFLFSFIFAHLHFVLYLASLPYCLRCHQAWLASDIMKTTWVTSSLTIFSSLTLNWCECERKNEKIEFILWKSVQHAYMLNTLKQHGSMEINGPTVEAPWCVSMPSYENWRSRLRQ